MNIIIFEDGNHENFYPISLTRPVWELKTGLLSLRERWELYIRDRIGHKIEIWYFTRDHIAPLFRERYPDLKINDTEVFGLDEEVLCINCTAVPGEEVFSVKAGILMMCNSIPIAARLKASELGNGADIAAALLKADGLSRLQEESLPVFKYIWDLVDRNAGMITVDFGRMGRQASAPSGSGVTIIGEKDQLFIEGPARIDPFSCIDLTGGPVVIGKGSVIHSFSRIEGPCVIGRDCVVLGAKLRGGCTIGDMCRIGGEVEQSIFQGYSNKYHDGFIGHAYLGEWINLGAMTANSDLKNNYAPVKVSLPGKRISTEKLKVGCFMGDFTRTSIGTLINTGSTIGAGCMIVHAGSMAPRFMPAFSWFMNNQLAEGESIAASISAFAAMTGRRGIELSNAFMELLRKVYEADTENRKAEVRKWRDQQK